eukprot:scaffold65703_cov48-Phaeocystis_antarctica.AAC.1
MVGAGARVRACVVIRAPPAPAPLGRTRRGSTAPRPQLSAGTCHARCSSSRSTVAAGSSPWPARWLRAARGWEAASVKASPRRDGRAPCCRGRQATSSSRGGRVARARRERGEGAAARAAKTGAARTGLGASASARLRLMPRSMPMP